MTTIRISPVGRMTFGKKFVGRVSEIALPSLHDAPEKVEKVPLGPDSFTAKVEWAEGFQPALAEFVSAVVAEARRKTEAEIMRLLGMWVSELEPAIVYSHADGRLIGLAPVGHNDTITLRAWS